MDWATVTLVACLLAITLAKQLYPRQFQQFISLPISDKYFLVQGKAAQIVHPFNILLFLGQVLSVSLFIYMFFMVFQPETTKTNPYLFVQICTGYLVFVFMKFCIEKIIGTAFSLDTVINTYLFQKLTYRNLISLLVFVFNLLLFFIVEPTGKILLIFAAIIVLFNGIALFYSYKTNRNIIFGNFFYFILYLCALEISPYFILYKTLV
ncbi:DUF4271 domain-containing protein [Marixanthomonas spongiae]|uniref:DUF4271 domain-containing protein n=1 Tax=Marixanthomonas spongiae TaxID=2174845 RepID=A0A2U0HZB7_9FLAO|nr:DUF4271 domain-containing protein [Marixanthomonas spongiae]PVW14166.1 DUF4271 domain-containing protein [Marixanthomonas spongiae]